MDWPRDTDWYRDIHDRLLRRDPTAPAELAESVYAALIATMARRFPNPRHRDLVEEAAGVTLLDYIKNPRQFNPAVRSLKGFLGMAATRDLITALKKRNRYETKEKSVENVEDLVAAGNRSTKVLALLAGEPLPDEKLIGEELWEQVESVLPDESDRELLALMLEGERSTESFAELLGLGRLPLAEKRMRVKQHKDRVLKRVRRLGDKLRDS